MKQPGSGEKRTGKVFLSGMLTPVTCDLYYDFNHICLAELMLIFQG
jgi:hypothetical protein